MYKSKNIINFVIESKKPRENNYQTSCYNWLYLIEISSHSSLKALRQAREPCGANRELMKGLEWNMARRLCRTMRSPVTRGGWYLTTNKWQSHSKQSTIYI